MKKSTRKEDAPGETTRGKCRNRGSCRSLKKERKVEIWKEICCVYSILKRERQVEKDVTVI